MSDRKERHLTSVAPTLPTFSAIITLCTCTSHQMSETDQQQQQTPLQAVKGNLQH